ncbi:hypothetical protein [Desulfothermobacter acidiphilus]|uniref:hypothetical protein n=1 Tax=Desulfothermobacter acidiphilus TaxID=1938353 RepID=UPI003F8876BE
MAEDLSKLQEELTRVVQEEVRKYLASRGDNNRGSSREGLWSWLNSGMDAKSFLIGAVAGLAVAALWPQLKPALKTCTQKVSEGLSELGKQVKTTLEETKESLTDIVAEAQFERLKGELEPEEGE